MQCKKLISVYGKGRCLTAVLKVDFRIWKQMMYSIVVLKIEVWMLKEKV